MNDVIEIEGASPHVSRSDKLKQLSKKGGATDVVERSARLRRYAQELNKGCGTLEECARGIVSMGQTAAKVALHLGDVLRQAKADCVHGEFGPWLRKNCKRISWGHANKLMRCSLLLEAASAAELPHIHNITELFLFCGIITKATPGQHSAPAFCFAMALRRITPATTLSIEDVRKLAPAEQSELRTKLEPVHRLYLALSNE